MVRTAQEWTTQYAVSLVVAVVVLAFAFPGNEFLPVPWQHDDYTGLAGHLKYLTDGPSAAVCVRPVSTNFMYLLGAAGETPYFLAMLLLAALVPVLAVRLAMGLFQSGAGPGSVIWLTAMVSCGMFLYEQSPWFYRYSGLWTNLTSLVLGMSAAYGFSRWMDGSKNAVAAGCIFLLLSAFAKEDMILFVPAYVTALWCIRWADMRRRPRWLPLGVVYGGLAIILAMVCVWNTWVVASPYTSGTGCYQLHWTPADIMRQLGRYATASLTPRILSIGLAIVVVAGILRREHRIAALCVIPLVISLALPYAPLPRFFAYYCMNWLAMGFALVLCGLATVWRPRGPRWLAILPWIVPMAIFVGAVLGNQPTAGFRRSFTAFLNQEQHNNRYLIEQVVRHASEFAKVETVALRGLDNVYSPWFLTDGRYINAKLGRQVRWLLAAKPDSEAARQMIGALAENGQVKLVLERDLTALPAVPVLEFDRHLNMTVHAGK